MRLRRGKRLKVEEPLRGHGGRIGFGGACRLWGVTAERSQFGVKYFELYGFATGLEDFEAVQGVAEVALDGVDAPLETGEFRAHDVPVVQDLALGATDLEVPPG